MIPDLQGSVVCEDVRVEASGSHTLVGVINFIGAPSLPIRLLKLCVWTRWSSGVGQYKQTTKIMAPDEDTIIAQAETQFSLQNEEAHTTNVNLFGGVELPATGSYHVEILLDDQMRLRYPFNVLIPPQPGG
jgi:hypothetical protein